MGATYRLHAVRKVRGRLVLLAAVVALHLLAAACGGNTSPPTPVDDPGNRARGMAVPAWFPAQFPPPEDGVVVEVIDEPTTGAVTFGRSVTWRVDRSYQQVLAGIDATLERIGWAPTDRLSTEADPDSRRTSIYIENGIVEVIRVFVDANLKGTRVTVELPT